VLARTAQPQDAPIHRPTTRTGGPGEGIEKWLPLRRGFSLGRCGDL